MTEAVSYLLCVHVCMVVLIIWGVNAGQFSGGLKMLCALQSCLPSQRECWDVQSIKQKGKKQTCLLSAVCQSRHVL